MEKNESLKKLMNINNNDVLGLDIGSSSVKIIELEKTDSDYHLKAASINAMAGNSDGSIEIMAQRSKKLINAIKIPVQKTKLAVAQSVGLRSRLENLTFQNFLKNEIEGAVEFEASQVCPFNLEDGVFDYQLLDDQEDATSGLLVAATNKSLVLKREHLKSVSLKNVLMDVDGLALINCLEKIEKLDDLDSVAILNIGHSYTNLAIIGKDRLPFIRDLNYAGKNIIKTISSIVAISENDIKNHLINSAKNSIDSSLINANLESASENLISDINNTLRFYIAQSNNSYIEKIFICGGFSIVKGLHEILKRRLPAQTELWNPFNKIKFTQQQDVDGLLSQKGPIFAVAAGLAMREI